MLNKSRQAALWNYREAAKTCCAVEVRDAAIEMIPLGESLLFYEGMIETCLMSITMAGQLHLSASPHLPKAKDLPKSERFIFGVTWALADIWEKKVGRKLFAGSAAAGHG